ncbi:MAG: alpha/beta fold hydrolase [Paracoccus sp. (in: a-proteobacteria)]|nr:alpha/beta fold hydrolase [Paracoccus sp. (in: a-proteobacteria)]
MVLLVLAVVLAAIWRLAPRESGRFAPPEIAELPDDLDAWLYNQEAGVPPEVARRIVWAGRPGRKTPVALVYIHGFSASSQEIRPVPDLIGAWRGANIHFTRLAGHGLDGASLGQAAVADWARDVAEAVAIGHQIGEKVVVIGTSTGATLAALAARDPVLGPRIDGVVMVSPNFGIRARGAFLLRQPLARHWLPLIAGRERCFTPQNERHRTFWTTCYPVTAGLPVAALVAAGAGANYRDARQPLLVIYAEADQVVDIPAAKQALASWGGPVTEVPLVMGPGDDPAAHVIAGDILSPGQTAPVATRINGWITQNFGE